MWNLLFGDDNESTSSEEVQEAGKSNQLVPAEDASTTSAIVPSVPATGYYQTLLALVFTQSHYLPLRGKIGLVFV